MTQVPASNYVIGLDLGKRRDYTALAVLKQRELPVGRGWEWHYELIHLERWRGKEYKACVPAVHKVEDAIRNVYHQETSDYRMTQPSWTWKDYGDPVIDLVVDQTGVGESVVESLRDAGLGCYGVMIHGGETVTRMDGGWRVPKRDLVGTAEVLLQNGRLKFAKDLHLADVLQNELQSFKATIKLSGHVSYAASEEWREGEHDDTVLALALAAWFGEQNDPHAWDDLNAYYALQ